MFETAVIRPHGSGVENVNGGILAETLIFYDKIHVMADRGLLNGLLGVIPPEDFLNLIKSKRISFSYSKSLHAIYSHKASAFEEHKFVSISINKNAQGKRITKYDEIRSAVTSRIGFGRASKKIVDGLIERTEFVDRGFQANQSLDIAHAELDNDEYLSAAVRTLIQLLVPTYQLPEKWEFRPLYIADSFTVATNLNFDDINEEYHKYVPPTHSSITPAFLLSHLLSARMDAAMAAEYLSEIITKDEVSALIRLKLAALIGKREKSIKQIDIFQETVLHDCRKIREAIDSGERTFSEFLQVLEKASRFKKWLANQNPDANLLTEYYRSVTADGPMDSLPAKTIRYVTTTLSGLLSPIAGLAFAGIDEFLVGRLFQGWRPNHFIEGPLKRFASSE
jgi:hypothetical protein